MLTAGSNIGFFFSMVRKSLSPMPVLSTISIKIYYALVGCWNWEFKDKIFSVDYVIRVVWIWCFHTFYTMYTGPNPRMLSTSSFIYVLLAVLFKLRIPFNPNFCVPPTPNFSLCRKINYIFCLFFSTFCSRNSAIPPRVLRWR